MKRAILCAACFLLAYGSPAAAEWTGRVRILELYPGSQRVAFFLDFQRSTCVAGCECNKFSFDTQSSEYKTLVAMITGAFFTGKEISASYADPVPPESCVAIVDRFEVFP